MTLRNGHPTFTSAARLWLALFALLPTVLLGPATAATPEMTDLGICDAVEDQLFSDPAVPHHRIGVTVNNGVVELEGSTTNVTAKRRAVELAGVIRGVRSVIDLIRVVPIWDVSDESLKADIREALFRDPATQEWEVDVEVADGSAVLTGVVDSWPERRFAERIAGNVRGVRDVENRLKVEVVEERGDDELEVEIQAMQRWDASLSRSIFRVRVEEGTAALTGSVCSLGEKVLAAKNAWVSGVTSVDAVGLEIVDCGSGRIGPRPLSTAPPADAEIAAAVGAALSLDPRVEAGNIRIGVDHGEVTLRGRVSNLRVQWAATEDAANTRGVTGVVNRLQLQSDLFLPEILLPDSELALLVSGALERDPYVERFAIGVAALGGTVYLTGSVDNVFDRARAEELAAGVAGVMEIKNHLEVLGPTVPRNDGRFVNGLFDFGQSWYRPMSVLTPTDASIQRTIEKRVWWSTEVDGEDISVHVEDGVAVLTGSVATWRERDSATRIAVNAGATHVRNRLDVGFPTVIHDP